MDDLAEEEKEAEVLDSIDEAAEHRESFNANMLHFYSMGRD